MEFLIILAVIIYIVIQYFVAKEFQEIANAKGFYYGGNKYFWITFFLGIIGILMVIALPDRGEDPAERMRARIDHVEKKQNDELPEL